MLEVEEPEDGVMYPGVLLTFWAAINCLGRA